MKLRGVEINEQGNFKIPIGFIGTKLFPTSPEIRLTKEEARVRNITKDCYVNIGGIKLFGKTFLPTRVPIRILEGGIKCNTIQNKS